MDWATKMKARIRGLFVEEPAFYGAGSALSSSTFFNRMMLDARHRPSDVLHVLDRYDGVRLVSPAEEVAIRLECFRALVPDDQLEDVVP